MAGIGTLTKKSWLEPILVGVKVIILEAQLLSSTCMLHQVLTHAYKNILRTVSRKD